MVRSRTLLLVLGLATAAAAQDTLQISIGVRETNAGGGTFTNIGADGGTLGGIEWIDLDAQTLILDGTWQLFTFDLANATVTAFAGGTANGVLEGAFGVLEHIRIKSNGLADPVTLFIDDVADSTTMGGLVTFGTFSPFNQGTEVMFQEPPFSGSTSANVVPGGTSGVDNFAAASRSESCRVDFQFVDNMTTRWLRLTSFNTVNQRNPLIRFDDGSVISFWMRGGTSQENAGSQGPGTAVAEMCGVGLSGGESSIYSAGQAPALAPGALGISRDGQPDFPFLGGNLVSGFGLITTLNLFADANGRVVLPPIVGSPLMTSLVLQSVFVDGGQPQGLTFTNAVRARFGQ